MNERTFQFYNIAEREPETGEPILFKLEDMAREGATTWSTGRYDRQTIDNGGVYLTEANFYHKDMIIEYTTLPDS